MKVSKFLFALWAMLFLLSSFWFIKSGRRTVVHYSAGFVGEAVGDVFSLRPFSPNWVKVEENSRLPPGSILKTSNQSQVRFELPKRMAVEMYPESEIVLSSLTDDSIIGGRVEVAFGKVKVSQAISEMGNETNAASKFRKFDAMEFLQGHSSNGEIRHGNFSVRLSDAPSAFVFAAQADTIAVATLDNDLLIFYKNKELRRVSKEHPVRIISDNGNLLFNDLRPDEPLLPLESINNEAVLEGKPLRQESQSGRGQLNTLLEKASPVITPEPPAKTIVAQPETAKSVFTKQAPQAIRDSNVVSKSAARAALPTPTSVQKVTRTPSPTPTPVQTVTRTPSPTPTPVQTVTRTPLPIPTPVQTVTRTLSPIPTPVPTLKRPSMPAESPVAVHSVSPTSSATPTSSPTPLSTVTRMDSTVPSPVPTPIWKASPATGLAYIDAVNVEPTPSAQPSSNAAANDTIGLHFLDSKGLNSSIYPPEKASDKDKSIWLSKSNVHSYFVGARNEFFKASEFAQFMKTSGSKTEINVTVSGRFFSTRPNLLLQYPGILKLLSESGALFLMKGITLFTAGGMFDEKKQFSSTMPDLLKRTLPKSGSLAIVLIDRQGTMTFPQSGEVGFRSLRLFSSKFGEELERLKNEQASLFSSISKKSEASEQLFLQMKKIHSVDLLLTIIENESGELSSRISGLSSSLSVVSRNFQLTQLGAIESNFLSALNFDGIVSGESSGWVKVDNLSVTTKKGRWGIVHRGSGPSVWLPSSPSSERPDALVQCEFPLEGFGCIARIVQLAAPMVSPKSLVGAKLRWL